MFADPQQLRLLNAIVHPRIIARTQELAAEQHRRNPHAVVIVDAALIFESGIGGTLRKVMVAWCRPEQQLERLMAKTGVSREEAERRIQGADARGGKAPPRGLFDRLLRNPGRVARPGQSDLSGIAANRRKERDAVFTCGTGSLPLSARRRSSSRVVCTSLEFAGLLGAIGVARN